MPNERRKKCGQVVKGTGTAEGEISCSKIDLKFERALLDHAQGKAETDARSKCPEGCKNIKLVQVKETVRRCRNGEVTLKFSASYECRQS